MQPDFFGSYGDTLQIHSGADFARIIKTIDTTVPPRTARRPAHRTPQHRERYCIVCYLQELFGKKKLRFPLTVSKGEHPDFIIEMNSLRYGLEHTDATTNEHQAAITNLEKSPGALLYGEKTIMPLGISNSERKKLMNQDCLYTGDDAEIRWANIMIESIDKKTKTLNKGHYDESPSYNELLIYDNSHVSHCRISVAINYLLQNISRLYRCNNFVMQFKVISIIACDNDGNGDYYGVAEPRFRFKVSHQSG